jgi:putative toxin-antitoxin system antitoxin component (TIGR02293 family)
MTAVALAKSPPHPASRLAGPKLAGSSLAKLSPAIVDPANFWDVSSQRRNADAQAWRRALQSLVRRVIVSGDVLLFEAVELGVPTYLVDMIAGALNEPPSRVMDWIGVAPTTFKRKDEAKEMLPEAAGQRVMGLLRVMATLRRALEESGDPDQFVSFDLEAWLAGWLKEPLPELKHKTPAEMLKNAEGQRALAQIIERMRGGLPA